MRLAALRLMKSAMRSPIFPPGFVERGRRLGFVQVVVVGILGLKVDPVDETIEEAWLFRLAALSV